MAMAAAARSKLAAVLALLGSPHQGERDAAALAADRLIKKHGLAWTDVLASGETPQQPKCNPKPKQQDTGLHLADLHLCGQRLDLLTVWECEFVANLAIHRTVSTRQREILAKIAQKVKAAGPRRG